MLTQNQIDEFQKNGIIYLKQLIDKKLVEKALNSILKRAALSGLHKDSNWQLKDRPFTPVPEAVSKLLGRTNIENSLGDLCEGKVESIISQLLDNRPIHSPIRNGQILFTLPNADVWTLPYANWHLDIARLSGIGLPGVQFFTFLNEVKPGGGGTLAVAGSHLLLNGQEKISSKKVRGRLKQWDFFKELMHPKSTKREKFISQPGRANDVELQVVEMHGKPGDVYLMDMRLLHTIAPNAAKVPRIMLTKRYFLKEAYEIVHGSQE